MRSVDATMAKKIFGLEYQRSPLGSLAVCDFCELEFSDENSFRPVVQKWQASQGLESLVEITGTGNLPVTKSIPTTTAYDFEDKVSIVESIWIRNKANLRDKGGLGALLGLFGGAAVGWALAISLTALQPEMFTVSVSCGILGLILGVVSWRLIVSKITTRKLVKSALSKHAMRSEALLSVTRKDPGRFRTLNNVLLNWS